MREETTGLFLADYPDFEETPRYTPSGRPWRSVVSTGCPYAAGEYDDCGSCPHLMKQNRGDLIGVCCHLSMRRNGP